MAVVSYAGDAAQDVGPEVVIHRVELLGDLPLPGRIGGSSEHHLDEAGIIRAAAPDLNDVVIVSEGRLVGEVLPHLGPPLPLLRSVAVALRRVRGVEPDQHHQLAVRGDPRGRTQPAGRAWRQFGVPALTDRLHRRGIADLAVDHLNEHVPPPALSMGPLRVHWSS